MKEHSTVNSVQLRPKRSKLLIYTGLLEPSIFEISCSGSSSRQIPAPTPNPTPTHSHSRHSHSRHKHSCHSHSRQCCGAGAGQSWTV